MRARLIIVVTGFVASMIVMSGCTSNTGGTASPAVGGQTTVPSDDAPSSSAVPVKAPRVPHPLDASKMVTTPCTALTSADVTDLHVVNSISGADKNAAAAQCVWTGSPGGSVSIGWETINKGGLSDLYEEQSTAAYWQPTTVSGYPAVYADELSDGRGQGDCVLNVGVNDHLYFIAGFNNPLDADQSCPLVAQAAADVIRNLGGS